MEFTYNNNYQATTGMSPFKALYGKYCSSSICWDEIGEHRMIRSKLVQFTNEVI